VRLTVDKRVENAHSTVGDTSIWVDLLEDYMPMSVEENNRMQMRET
jgi:hypothetical protein